MQTQPQGQQPQQPQQQQQQQLGDGGYGASLAAQLAAYPQQQQQQQQQQSQMSSQPQQQQQHQAPSSQQTGGAPLSAAASAVQQAQMAAYQQQQQLYSQLNTYRQQQANQPQSSQAVSQQQLLGFQLQQGGGGGGPGGVLQPMPLSANSRRGSTISLGIGSEGDKVDAVAAAAAAAAGQSSAALTAYKLQQQIQQSQQQQQQQQQQLQSQPQQSAYQYMNPMSAQGYPQMYSNAPQMLSSGGLYAAQPTSYYPTLMSPTSRRGSIVGGMGVGVGVGGGMAPGMGGMQWDPSGMGGMGGGVGSLGGMGVGPMGGLYSNPLIKNEMDPMDMHAMSAGMGMGMGMDMRGNPLGNGGAVDTTPAAGRKRKKAAAAAPVVTYAPDGSMVAPAPVKSRGRADSDARATRIRKHNEAEVRRRQRLKNLLTELSNEILCTKTHKSLILRTAIERVRVLKDKLMQLGVNVRELLVSTVEGGQPGDDDGSDEEEAPKARAASKGAAARKSNGSDSDEHADSPAAGTTPAPIAEEAKSAMTAAANIASAAASPLPIPLPASMGGVSMQPLGAGAVSTAFDAAMNAAKKQRLDESGAVGGLSLSVPLPAGMAQVASGPYGPLVPPICIVPAPVLGLSHHTLFHSSSTALDVIDHQGNILDCNEAFARFVGYSRDVLLEKGTTFLGLTHPDSLAASYKLMRPLVSGQRKVTRAVKKYVCSNGTVKNSIVTCWLLHSDNGAEADSSAAAASSAAGSSTSSQGSGLGAVAAAAPSPSGGSRILLQAMIEEIPLDINEAQLAQLIPDETVLESIRSGGSLGATASAAEMQGLPVKLETTLSSPAVLAAAAAATDAATSTLPAPSS